MFAVLAAALLQAPGVISKTNTHDLYVVFDGIWRIFSGQQIFRDFHSPIGIAYFVPYMVLRHFETFSLLTLFHGNLLVALWLLSLATLTLRRRLAPPLFFWAALGIVAVAISPRTADAGVTVFSHLAPYNRWCEAATMLAAPLVLLSRTLPGEVTRWNSNTDVAGGLTLACLSLFLFHIKISFFLCVAGLTGVGLLFQAISLRTVALALLVCGLVSAGLEATLHLHRPYFSDLDMAVRATLEVYGKVRLANVATAPMMFVGYLSAATVFVWLATAPDRRPAWLRHRSLLLMVALALALAAATNLQISPQAEIPLMGAILLVTAELLRRQGATIPSPPGRRIVFYLVFFLVVAATPLVEAAAIVLHGVQSRTSTVCPVPILRGTAGSRLLFSRWALNATGSRVSCADLDIRVEDIAKTSDKALVFDGTRLEVSRLTDAFHLLRDRPAAGQALLALDFANPVPAFTGSQSPRGALLWWDLGRNYSLGSRPDPATLLQGVDFVLQSRLDPPVAWERHGENAWKVYGPQVTSDFEFVEQARLWRLWIRKTARGGGPATPKP